MQLVIQYKQAFSFLKLDQQKLSNIIPANLLNPKSHFESKKKTF